ncbi:MAG: hypothetical protein FJ404_11205 [Verrucomicrobia bacterium]|nr:hypothetical protein [Verrucomicrobiota bacterium]
MNPRRFHSGSHRFQAQTLTVLRTHAIAPRKRWAMEREEIAAADGRERKRRERRAPTPCGCTALKMDGSSRLN